MGNIAINDFLLIEATIYKLLKKHVRHKPYYVDVLDLFHEVSVNYAAALVALSMSFPSPPLFFHGVNSSMFSKVSLICFWRAMMCSSLFLTQLSLMSFVSLQMPHSGDLKLVKCHQMPRGWGGLGIGRAIILKFINLLVYLSYTYIHTSRAVFPCMLKVVCI